MERVEFLTFAAQSKGAIGVREFLQEHRQHVPDVLQGLSTVVLLGDRDEADFGIRMEQLTLRVQREIWSALASGASPSEGAAVELARAFLQVAERPRRCETDTICLTLARIVLSRVEGDEMLQETTTRDAAFRRRMRRLTLNRVKFPSLEDEDDRVIAMSVQKPIPSSGGVQSAETTSIQLTKRPRAEVPVDQSSMEQSARKNVLTTTGQKEETLDRPPLTKEMEDHAAELAKQLVQLSRSDATAVGDDVATRAFDMLAEVVNDTHTTYAANERSFQYLCKMLRMDCTSDEALLQIASALVESNWSSRYASIFIETSVLPKIRAADSVISRVLLQAGICFGSSYANTLIDSLLLPLLVGGKNADADSIVGPAQAEAITRILRSTGIVPADQLDGFIQKSLTAETNDKASNLSPHLLSNESALLVFQNILNTKPVLSPLTVERFVGACETALEGPEAEQIRGSLKFATVIFTLISKYPQQCTGHVEALEAIATQLTSIMSKATLRSLQKLKTSK